MSQERPKPHKRPNEPIGPTTVPGQATDPKIPPDQMPEDDEDLEEREESEKKRGA